MYTLEEVHVNPIKEGAKKFPTVQTRKKFKVETLQKVPVCTAQVAFCSLITDVCTAPGIVEMQAAFGFDRWLTRPVLTASLPQSHSVQLLQHPVWHESAYL